jgi:hypothetical protein
MRRVLSVVFVNLVVFAVLAEILGVLVHYEDTGRLFYRHQKTYELLPETAAGELSDDGLHPYFGPLHRPGVRPASNNIGFTSPYRMPVAKSGDDEFIIGIFGGSVGESFCQHGAARMIERLASHRFFSGRRMVPLCFSHEGYKQPQQLLVVAYFLSIGQQFDLVINIDGFNEVALSALNRDRGRDISMPSPLHLDPLLDLIAGSALTPAKVELLAAISRHKGTLNRVAAALPRARLASAAFVMDRYYRWTMGRYRAAVAEFAALPPTAATATILEVTPPLKARDGAVVYDDIASQWIAASLLMNSMLTARGVPYLHVLQPNQYHTARRFSEAEARVALNDSTPFKGSVQQGYPVLLRWSNRARQQEQFFDATTIFDGEPRAIYQDDCCHYNELGNLLFADAIAARVLTVDGPWGK